ncbi:uncharacterized protein LOC135091597 [Scylla paramamosain]|uniref:uncharacterized protein LOC135091597 n=1 Tax=Scylla paramamosain TaxID=85552 RepID=UPI003083489C
MVIQGYLATGMSQRQVARYFCVGRSTTCNIIRDASKVIWEIFGPLFMAKPTTEDWKRIAKEFNSRWDFPKCLSAIDDKHIQIEKPRLSGSLYYKYKRTFSVVLLAVADVAYIH